MSAILAGLVLLAGSDEPRRTSYQIDVCVTAVRTDAPRAEQRVRFLSEPRVITTSGRPAVFRVGETVPLVEGIVGPGVAKQTTGIEVQVIAVERSHHRVWVETEIRSVESKRTQRAELEGISGFKQRFRVKDLNGHDAVWVEVRVAEKDPDEDR